MAKKKEIHKRIWLAPRDADSTAYAAYTMWSYGDDNMDVTIADCHRSISLHMNDRASRRKIEKLRDFLTEAMTVYDGEQ